MKNLLWIVLVWMPLLMGCNLNRLQQAKEALDNHDLAGAEKQYRAILERSPKNVDALIGLGWTYHLALKKEEALSQFTFCLGVDPSNVECLRGKSSVLLSQGDTTQARLWLDKAKQIAPDDPEVLVSDAIWRLAQGEISKASKQLELVVARFPKEGKYRLPYAEALLRETKSKEALQQLEAGLVLDIPRRTSAMMWILRARILLELSARGGDDCGQITKIQQWVSEAERSLDEANNTGVEVPNSGVVQRQCQRRRTTLQEKCANEVSD